MEESGAEKRGELKSLAQQNKKIRLSKKLDKRRSFDLASDGIPVKKPYDPMDDCGINAISAR